MSSGPWFPPELAAGLVAGAASRASALSAQASAPRRLRVESSTKVPTPETLEMPRAGDCCGFVSAGVRAGGALDHLEGAAGDALQLVQVLVVPALVAAAAEVPVGAVVGDDQAVALHRQRDRLR